MSYFPVSFRIAMIFPSGANNVSSMLGALATPVYKENRMQAGRNVGDARIVLRIGECDGATVVRNAEHSNLILSPWSLSGDSRQRT